MQLERKSIQIVIYMMYGNVVYILKRSIMDLRFFGVNALEREELKILPVEG